MMEEKKITVQNNHIGFFGLLTIVLLLLKVFGKISIGWIWVFAPLWVPFGLLLGFLMLVFVIAVLVQVFDASQDRKKDEIFRTRRFR
jgi:hypothetical protein